MGVVAFAGGIKVTSIAKGVLLTKKGENWGDPWQTQDESIVVTDVNGLIKALQSVQSSVDNYW